MEHKVTKNRKIWRGVRIKPIRKVEKANFDQHQAWMEFFKEKFPGVKSLNTSVTFAFITEEFYFYFCCMIANLTEDYEISFERRTRLLKVYSIVSLLFTVSQRIEEIKRPSKYNRYKN